MKKTRPKTFWVYINEYSVNANTLSHPYEPVSVNRFCLHSFIWDFECISFYWIRISIENIFFFWRDKKIQENLFLFGQFIPELRNRTHLLLITDSNLMWLPNYGLFWCRNWFEILWNWTERKQISNNG